MAEARFIQNTEQASSLLKHWKLGLELETASTNSLTPANASQLQIEGSVYCQLPLNHPSVAQFALNQQPILHWYWRTADIPFLRFLQTHAEQSKWRPSFAAGFPVLRFKNKYNKTVLASLFNFTVPSVNFPKNTAHYAFNPPPLSLNCPTDNFAYLLDGQLLQEFFDISPKVLRQWQQGFKTKDPAVLWPELAAELQSGTGTNSTGTTDTASTPEPVLMQIYESLKLRMPPQVQLLPHLLVQAKTHADPTLQLQKDLQEMQTENVLEALEKNHPAWLYLNGQNKQKNTAKTLLAQHHENGLTSSQEMIIKAAKTRQFTVVQGPPGSGKTFTVQSLFAERLFDFVIDLKTLQSRNRKLKHLTLLTSTNNQAVDKGLAGLNLPGLLPVVLRLGNRHKITEQTKPFLANYLQKLSLKNPQHSLEQFTIYKNQLQKALAPTHNNWQRYELARQTLDAWVSANRDLVIPFLEKMIEEIEQYQHLRCLHSTQNIELLATLFPLIGNTLLSIRSSFVLKPNLVGMSIIDEAGQCTPAAVFPLLFRSRKAVMLGDIHQLEPIFNLPDSDWHIHLNHSALPPKMQQNFLGSLTNTRSAQQVALDGCQHPLHFEEHFRCHPKIIQISIDLCGYNLKPQAEKQQSKWLQGQPLWFLDTKNVEQPYAESWFNAEEAKAVVSLVQHLLSLGLPPESMAVLTPFRGQFYHLLSLFNNIKLAVARGDVEKQTQPGILVGTIHRLQGGERPLVIFSNVLNQKSPDFLNAKVNLLNVAVSRAQQHFVFIGSLNNLKQGAHGQVLHQHLQKNGQDLAQYFNSSRLMFKGNL